MDDDLRAAEAYISPSERIAALGVSIEEAQRRWTRRQVLARGAVAGSIVFVTPTIVAATRADAAGLGSRPPKTPPRQVTTPPAANPVMGPPLATGIPPSLPFTGNNELAGTEIGASALAAGAALWYLGHKARTL